jgi:hypothetical protein
MIASSSAAGSTYPDFEDNATDVIWTTWAGFVDNGEQTFTCQGAAAKQRQHRLPLRRPQQQHVYAETVWHTHRMAHPLDQV